MRHGFTSVAWIVIAFPKGLGGGESVELMLAAPSEGCLPAPAPSQAAARTKPDRSIGESKYASSELNVNKR